MAFVKLHGTILDSSVWSLPSDIRIVWVTMLAMADEFGVVAASVSGLARRAVVSVEACQAALDMFLAPDPDSRDGTTGERIERVPGGWLILNHANYRERRTRTQVLTAARVAKYREKHRAESAQRSVTGNEVTPYYATSPSEAEADADTEPEYPPSPSVMVPPSPSAQAPAEPAAAAARAKDAKRPDHVAEDLWRDWLVHRRRKKATATQTALDGIQREAAKAGISLSEALSVSITQGWQGFRAEWFERERRKGLPPRRKFLGDDNPPDLRDLTAPGTFPDPPELN